MAASAAVRRARDKGWIVAFDVGMSCSGFSYGQARGDSNVIGHCFEHNQIPLCKIPTAVLLTLDKGTDRDAAAADGLLLDLEHFDTDETKFGFEARDKYNQLDHIEMDRMLYFERFKMDLAALSGKHPTSREWQGTVATRTEALFAATLVYLRTIADRVMAGRTSGRSRAEGVRYVVTVPAKWSERAKKIVRSAACRAGLDADGDLLISIEPEAASYAIRKNMQVLDRRDTGAQNAQERRFKEKERAHGSGFLAPDEVVVGDDKLIICPEDAYMVCDCGGGTIDFTCHVVVKEGVVREALAHEAGEWGSCKIDVALLKLIGELVQSPEHTEAVMERLRRERPVAFLSLVDECERAKIVASPNASRVLVRFPSEVAQFLEDYHGDKSLEDVVADNWRTSARNPGERAFRVSYDDEDELLDMSRELFVQEILRPTHDQIVKRVRSLMQHRYMKAHCRYLFLVGGFADSKFLREELVRECRDQFPQVRVFRPTNPQHAIVEGAVLFARHPEYISERKMKFALGFEVMREFSPGIDPEHLREVRRGTDGRPDIAMCRRVFQPLVLKGQAIAVNHTVTQTYQVPRDNRQLRVTLYRVRYTTPPQYLGDPLDPLFTEYGQIHVADVHRLNLGPARAVEFEFRFGITEIQFQVTNPHDRSETLDFTIDFNVGNYQHEKTDLLDRVSG